MYLGALMHRTQIYFEESLFEEIRKEAIKRKKSISSFIRDVLKKELKNIKQKEKIDFNEIAGLWESRDIDMKTLREKAWKR